MLLTLKRMLINVSSQGKYHQKALKNTVLEFQIKQHE